MRPNPTADEFKRHDYWRATKDDLHVGYDGLCAYTAIRVPLGPSATVDHFKPKSAFAALAYEWSNYRLATALINSYKGEQLDIIDPIGMDADVFHMDFTTFHVVPNPARAMPVVQAAVRTLNRLRLNDDDTFVNQRVSWLRQYAEKGSIDVLSKNAPFLAREVERQGALTQLRKAFRVKPKRH